MPQIKKEVAVPTARAKRIYTNSELQSFDDEMRSKYRKEVTFMNGEKGFIFDYKQLHIDKMTTDEHGAINVRTDGVGDIITPSDYELLEDKIDQWHRWDWKNNKTLERLDKVAIEKAAENLTIAPTPDVGWLSPCIL